MQLHMLSSSNVNQGVPAAQSKKNGTAENCSVCIKIRDSIRRNPTPSLSIGLRFSFDGELKRPVKEQPAAEKRH